MVHFLIHDETDTVGVAVVDLAAGENVTGRTLDTQRDVVIRAASVIPLGHKIALQDHRVGDTVIKYGHDIGKVVVAIKTGEHVHVHNVKTKRW